MSWTDCKDGEVQENEEEVEQSKETRQEEELMGEKPPGLEANEEVRGKKTRNRGERRKHKKKNGGEHRRREESAVTSEETD